MTATANLSALLRNLPNRDRAMLAVELIDSLGDTAWEDGDLARLAEERDDELESGAVVPMSYEEFLSGICRPNLPK